MDKSKTETVLRRFANVPTSLKHRRQRSRVLADFFDGFTTREVERVLRPEIIEDFLDHLRKRGDTPYQLRSAWVVLKKLSRFASVRLGFRHRMAGLKCPIRVEKKLSRRAMSREEWQTLKEWLLTTKHSHVQHVDWRMTAYCRCVLYRIQLVTGYRVSEVLSLRGVDLVQDNGWWLRLARSGTKNREPASQPITEALAQAIQKLIAERKRPEDRIFPFTRQSTLVQFKRDLRLSRKWAVQQGRQIGPDFLMYVNSRGEQMDLHSMRHTCATWLCAEGNKPKVVQQIMRHSSITLTMDTYGHLFDSEVRDAVEQMPDV